MPATKTEQLDELLAMARECGRLTSKLAALEHASEWGTKTDKANLRNDLRKTREALSNAEHTLTQARTRYLAGWNH